MGSARRSSTLCVTLPSLLPSLPTTLARGRLRPTLRLIPRTLPTLLPLLPTTLSPPPSLLLTLLPPLLCLLPTLLPPAPNCVTEDVILVTQVCTPAAEEVCSTETVATQDGRWQLAGIISWGIGCGDRN